jgi:DNA adenine methylase
MNEARTIAGCTGLIHDAQPLMTEHGILNNKEWRRMDGIETNMIAQRVKAGPFLKWVGGKTQLLTQFEAYFPQQFQHYYEPFVGSGAVFFHLQPAHATLSDSNPYLIGAYQHIQTRVEDVIARLCQIRSRYYALAPDEQQQEYYRVRTRYNQLPAASIEKTACLIFLNKTGYNGLYRENASGGYNVPFGRYTNPAIFDETNLRAVSYLLQQVRLMHDQYDQVVRRAQAGDFVYFDPPYMPISKTSLFTSYTKGTFSVEQQANLAEVTRQLAGRGVQVMLSNSNSDTIKELYRDFYVYEVRASRMVNSKAALRGKIPELLITTYPTN